jgi:hypothetical protein
MGDAVTGEPPPPVTPGAQPAPVPEQWPRLLALFGGATAVSVGAQLPLWAYEHGVPHDRGLRALLRFPMLVLRLVRGVAAAAALFAGGTLLLEARQRWLAHLEEVRVLAPLPPPLRP